MTENIPQLSVVVPVFNEEDNVAPLIHEITAALRGVTAFEIVYIDDHSRDGTLPRLQALKNEVPELRVIHHVSQSGQSTAVRNGVIKMNIDTDTQYAFSRSVADSVLKNYDGFLKVDGGVGNKKVYDPRAWGKAAETAMAARVVEATEELGSKGHSISSR